MNILSQRDPRWAKVKLGNSNLTIGSSGCLVTCLAMACGLNPDAVNAKLKAFNGFSGALVVWSAITQSLPGLRFVWRSSQYDNNAVISQIKRNGFCAVEATTLFNGKHWVLFIGNRQLYDPWYGTQRPTSAYLRYTGFAAIDRV